MRPRPAPALTADATSTSATITADATSTCTCACAPIDDCSADATSTSPVILVFRTWCAHRICLRRSERGIHQERGRDGQDAEKGNGLQTSAQPDGWAGRFHRWV